MPERTHYQVLGVSETASIEEIKKQYRAMARKFHPDVNPGPEAARQFSTIAEAYRILSDSEARRLYDADRALKARVEANTFRAAASTGATAAPGPSPKVSTTATQEADRLVQQAQASHVRGRHIEARNLAEQALRYNRRNAQAWEVLGDICRTQGRMDDALHNYSMAVQIEPRNAALQQKIERLARQPSGTRLTPGGYTPNPAARPQTTRSAPFAGAGATLVAPEKRPLARVLMGFIGYFGSFLILLFAALQLNRSSSSLGALPFVSSWSWPFIGCLAVTGCLLGATMTITGAVRRIEDDLILTGGSEGAKTIPLGIFVLALGSLFFWAGMILHIAISAIQEALTGSLLRLYGVLVLVTLLFAAVWGVPDGFAQTMLWGGNVLFIGYVIGWLLGDFFRED